METRIAENIRDYRKQRGLTQEQLAEVLGVSVGAVYKWESKSSLPELKLIVEMADFFDVSVDALLGYQMKDNHLASTVHRLNEYCRTRDPEALAEAEKALKKYPHSFEIVHGCASVYLVFGVGSRGTKNLRRALELLEQRVVVAARVQDHDGLQVEAELLPGNHLHQLLQCPAAARQCDAAVAHIGNRLLTLVHITGLDEAAETFVMPVLFHHERGDDACHLAAFGQTGIARSCHQSHIPGSVDETDAAATQFLSQLACSFEEVGMNLRAGSTIDSDSHRIPKASLIRST